MDSYSACPHAAAAATPSAAVVARATPRAAAASVAVADSGRWMPARPRSPGFGSCHGSQVVSQQKLCLERQQQQLHCATDNVLLERQQLQQLQRSTANSLLPQPPPRQPEAIKAPPACVADCPPPKNAGRVLPSRKALMVPTVPAPASATAPKFVSCSPTPRCRDCDSRCR